MMTQATPSVGRGRARDDRRGRGSDRAMSRDIPEAQRAGRGHGDPGAGLDLLERAAGSILQACHAQTTADRYIHAHLGAQRAAAALIVARSAQACRRGRDGKIAGVWEALGGVAPEFGEWADYLALCGRRRVGIEAGGRPPASREADDLLRGAETFLGLIRAALGLPVGHEELPLPFTRPNRPGASKPGLRLT